MVHNSEQDILFDKFFSDFYAQKEELNWLNGEFPLTMEQIREMVIDRCDLPEGYNVDTYDFFQGTLDTVNEQLFD